ncbi:hypothetical protein [Chromobacterium sphagni]|uniref:hypothetical protein n=1 Tax=Chromobacterium sphagni TaxID=1903179 RepID=UPI001F4D45C4|nr:hypothetical protein [Chromobacterium sphagni]
MSRRHKKPAVRSTTMAAAPAEAGSMQAFSFGEPVPMLDRREIMDYCNAPTPASGMSRPSPGTAWRAACGPMSTMPAPWR